MARAATTAGLAMEVFVEQNEIPPIWIGRVLVDLAVTWALAVLVRQEDPREPTGKLVRNLLERHHVSRTSRALDFERLAIEKVIAFERFDDKKVDREPNRPAPIRVSAEEVTVSFSRDVIDAVLVVAHAEHVGMIAMIARDRTQTVGREEFVLIEHVAQRPAQPLARRDRQHAVSSGRARLAVSDERSQVFAVIEEPFHPFLESGQLVDLCCLD